MYVLDVIAALFFVASAGLLFNERFRKNIFLVILAGLLALASTYYLTKEIVREVVREEMPTTSIVTRDVSKKPERRSAATTLGAATPSVMTSPRPTAGNSVSPAPLSPPPAQSVATKNAAGIWVCQSDEDDIFRLVSDGLVYWDVKESWIRSGDRWVQHGSVVTISAPDRKADGTMTLKSADLASVIGKKYCSQYRRYHCPHKNDTQGYCSIEIDPTATVGPGLRE